MKNVGVKFLGEECINWYHHGSYYIDIYIYDMGYIICMYIYI